MGELRPYFVAEWRMRQRPKAAARTVCSCDGQKISLNRDIEVAKKRPPKGAVPGEVFGADELRDSAQAERIKELKARLVLAQLKQKEIAAEISAADRELHNPAKFKHAEKALPRLQSAHLRARQEAGRLDALLQAAENPPPRTPATPRARKPRPVTTCPPNVAACSIGMLGGVCGLPAPLVLAAAQGSPVVREARFCLASVWSLTPSHNPLRGFAPSAGYPAEVQERAYDRDKGEQLKVIRIAQTLIPELVFNGAPGAIDGLPVVTSRGIVLGGNGRTQALQLHYSQGETAARDFLLDHAAQFGFTREQIAAVSDPAIVRVIETPDPESSSYRPTLRELVRLLNVPLLQSLGVREEAVAEGRRLSDDALDVLSVGLGEDQTLAEYLSSRHSRAFSDALRRAGILTDRNVVRLLEADGDTFSDEGKTFVERLLVGSLVPDAALLEHAGGQLRGTLARGAPWLLSAAASGADWDLRPALGAALRDLLNMRRRDARSVDAFLKQTALGEGPAVLSVPNGEAMLRVLYDLAARPVLFGRFARKYAEISRRNLTAQGGLFPQEIVTPADAIRQAAPAS